MKKWIKPLTGFTAFIMTLAIGIFLGTQLEQYEQNQTNGHLHNSTQIAIVNLDEGVLYQNEQRNFAKEILETYPEGYTLTGLEDAKTGLTDGRYAAYVILPSDFSVNVASINTDPKKSLLKYEIGGDLSQEATDKAWQSVMKLKERLNDDVSYVYISAILGEFHEGQDYALKVLANDSTDKDVLMAISNLDLITMLDLTEVERLQNNIEELNINPDFETNQAIIESIDTAYQGYMNETASELSSLKEEENQVHQDITNINNCATAIEGVFKEDGNANYTLTSTETQFRTYQTLLGTHIQNIETSINDMETNSMNQNQIIKNTIAANLDNLYTDMTQEHDQSLKTQNHAITNIFKNHFLGTQTQWDLNSYPELNKVIEEYDAYLSAQYQVQQKLMTGYQDYVSHPPENDTESLKDRLISLYQNDEEMNTYLSTIALFNGYTDSLTIADYLSLYFENGIQNPSLRTRVQTALNQDLNNKWSLSLSQISSTNINDQVNDHLSSHIQTIKQQLNSFSHFDASVLKEDMDQLNQITHDMTYETIENTIKSDLSSLHDKQIEQKKALYNAIDIHQNLSNQLTENLTLYDPLSHIDEEEIKNYVKQFSENNHQTQRKVEDKNREYLTFVSDSYNNADEQVSTMRQDITKYQQESDEKISTGLDEAKSVKEETSSSNASLMNSYIQKLPYTRNGTVSNTVVYDFVTSPVEMEGIKEDHSLVLETYYIKLLLITIPVVIVIAWGVSYFIYKKKLINQGKTQR